MKTVAPYNILLYCLKKCSMQLNQAYRKLPRYFASQKYALLFTLLGFVNMPLMGQSLMGRDSTEMSFKQSPPFSIYKDNYFITGTSINEQPSKYNSDIKFQFSFKQRLLNKPLIAGAYLYLIYTQKSFWDIYLSSSPFAESNYNPGLLLVKPVYKDNALRGIVTFSAEHESNGRDSIYSRSWNYAAVSYAHLFSSKFTASVKLFIPFGLSDNKDLAKYIGYTETQLSWVIKKDQLILDVVARKGSGWDTKGSLMTSLSYRPFKDRNQYLILQMWNGYAESLIDYRNSRSMIRLGIVIKPSVLRFY